VAEKHASVSLLDAWSGSDDRPDRWPLFALATQLRQRTIATVSGVKRVPLPHATRCSLQCTVEVDVRETGSTIALSYCSEWFDRDAMRRFATLFALGVTYVARNGLGVPVRTLEIALLKGLAESSTPRGDGHISSRGTVNVSA